MQGQQASLPVAPLNERRISSANMAEKNVACRKNNLYDSKRLTVLSVVQNNVTESIKQKKMNLYTEIKTCRMQTQMIPTAAKMQKDCMADKIEEALTAKTTKSVIDVT